MTRILQFIARIGQPIGRIGLPTAGIRHLTARFPIAAAVLSTALVAAAGWWLYQSLSQAGVHSAPPAATTPRPQSSTAAGPAATATPAPGTPRSRPTGPAGGSTAGTSPSQGKPASGAAAKGGGAAGVPTTGVRDPFRPLVGSGAAVLPPVPPLPPGGLGAGGPSGVFRVTGIIRDTVALAIVEEGPRSYVVEVGEVLRPGVRLAAIDARRGVVQLIQDGLPVELRLAEGGKAP